MNRKDVIKFCLSKGVQIDDEIVDFITEREELLDKLIEFTKKKNELIISKKILDDFMKLKNKNIKILKKLKIRKEFTTADVITFFRNRFDFFFSILRKRMELVNLISVNKITPKSRKFSLIVFVREIDRKNNRILAEDLSGYIQLTVRKDIEYLVEDEVIGVICRREKDMIITDKIIFPDIPLMRGIKKLNENLKIIFISTKGLDSLGDTETKKLLSYMKDDTYVFVFGKLPDNLKRKIKNYYEVEEDTTLQFNGFIILLTNGKFISRYSPLFGKKPVKTMQILLKKRHVNPVFDGKLYENDFYLLDEIPDIVVFPSEDPDFLNYKGITIISIGNFISKPIFWMIDLKTRETIKLLF